MQNPSGGVRVLFMKIQLRPRNVAYFHEPLVLTFVVDLMRKWRVISRTERQITKQSVHPLKLRFHIEPRDPNASRGMDFRSN